MKKIFLYILIISVLFFGCNSKENEQKVIELETKLLGSANVYNVLQAVALAHEFGLSDEQIKISEQSKSDFCC